MGAPNVTRLAEAPVVGRLYSVPTVAYPWLFEEHPRTWPVLLPAHTDPLLGFHHPHYHVDVRFLRPAQLREAARYGREYYRASGHWALVNQLALSTTSNEEQAAIFVAQRTPVCRRPDGKLIPLPAVEWRNLRCARSSAPYLQEDLAVELADHFAGQQCRRVRSGWVCPHQGFPLGSVPPDAAGVITCPVHGLRISAASGRVLEDGERIAA